MRKELQAKYFNDATKLIIGIGVFLFIITGLLVKNSIIPYDVFSGIRLIVFTIVIIGLLMLLLSRIIFPFYHLIKKATKPGVDDETKISLLTESIELEPTIEAYLERANAKSMAIQRIYDVNWRESAIEDCDWVINKNPNIVRAYWIKGFVLDELDRKEEAAKNLTKILHLHPIPYPNSNYRPYFARASYHLKSGNIEAATLDLKQSIAKKEPARLAHFLLGFAKEKLGNKKEALENYAQFLTKHGIKEGINETPQAMSLIRRTNILLEQNNYEEARNEWKRYKESGLSLGHDFLNVISDEDYKIEKRIEEKIKEK